MFMYFQVSSAVPEGKGVSSSASVEVSSMSAIAAAHGDYTIFIYLYMLYNAQCYVITLVCRFDCSFQTIS